MNIDAEVSAVDMADTIVNAFARLYPKLSLPHNVWDVLREMISREMRGHLMDNDLSAIDLLVEPYLADAIASGLR